MATVDFNAIIRKAEVNSLRPLISKVVGPTASGKSDLGIALAERFDGERVRRMGKKVMPGYSASAYSEMYNLLS